MEKENKIHQPTNQPTNKKKKTKLKYPLSQNNNNNNNKTGVVGFAFQVLQGSLTQNIDR